MKEQRSLLLAIFGAYLFSVLFHLYWIHWASSYAEFYWNGELMINNVDGYFFGSGAQKILYGMHADNPRLEDVWKLGTSVITAAIVKATPFSLDTVMLYMPPLFASLLVVPIILITRLYGSLLWGFCAALIASIAWSYYNRTLAGYYDTDMFSVLVPTFVLYFLLYAIKRRSLNALLAASIAAIIYPWLYQAGHAVIYALIIMTFLYLLLFLRHEPFSYTIIIMLSLVAVPYIHFLLVIGAYILFRRQNVEIARLKRAALITLVLFLVSSNVFGIIAAKVWSYVAKEDELAGLHFLHVIQTVREAGKIPFDVVADRIVGSLLGFFIAVVGYLLLVVCHREFLLALPFWGIGLFAYFGGLRFTIYAVPIAALSGTYLFFYLAQRFGRNRLLYAFAGTVLLLAPNITHIVGCCERVKWLDYIRVLYPLKSYPYLTPTTFYKDEVALLDRLRQKSDPKDYVLTWWDYGYPIWYYANLNTLIDGGKHHEDNYLVSKILTTDDQILAYNLAKISIKTYVETNKTVAPQLFIRNERAIDVAEYLQELSIEKREFSLDRDIYIMLPHRMLAIFPTVAAFSQRDLNSGAVFPKHFYYINGIRQLKNGIAIGALFLDTKRGLIRIGKRSMPVKQIFIIGFDAKGRSIYEQLKVGEQGLNVIINKSFGEGVVVDDFYLDSLFFQLYFFDRYDPELFEPVIINPWIKIYKLR